MIAVDTSVWIDHLRDSQTQQVLALRDVILHNRDIVVVGDLVLAEILQGLASDREAAVVGAALSRFLIMSVVGEDIAVQAARNYRALRALGITIRRTIDVLIGTFCIESNISLLHADRDFDPMERHLGLAVFPVAPSP
jgi:predicted nucleic acid-binding protein